MIPLPSLPAGAVRLRCGGLVLTLDADTLSLAQEPKSVRDQGQFCLDQRRLGAVGQAFRVGVLDRLADGCLQLIERAGALALDRRRIRFQRLLQRDIGRQQQGGRLDVDGLVHHGVSPYFVLPLTTTADPDHATHQPPRAA